MRSEELPLVARLLELHQLHRVQIDLKIDIETQVVGLYTTIPTNNVSGEVFFTQSVQNCTVYIQNNTKFECIRGNNFLVTQTSINLIHNWNKSNNQSLNYVSNLST